MEKTGEAFISSLTCKLTLKLTTDFFNYFLDQCQVKITSGTLFSPEDNPNIWKKRDLVCGSFWAGLKVIHLPSHFSKQKLMFSWESYTKTK